MSFLILSRQHHLLPIANRLRKEGEDVSVLMYHAKRGGKYEEAYSGVIDLVGHRGEKDWNRKLEAMKALAAEGKVRVVTDSYLATKHFHDAQNIFPAVRPESLPSGPLRFGAWFDGESFSAEHFLIVDEGACHSGLGARVDAAMTLVRSDHSVSHLSDGSTEADELKSRGFKGLVQWGLRESEGDLALSEDRALGWPHLHTHAFLAEMEVGSLLEGGPTQLDFPFTVVLVVSQPPWPREAQHPRGQFPIEGLTSEESGHVFWHDVKVDTENRTIRTLGLDGMVGVVRASANSFELAQAKALGIAAKMSFPEKQYRNDAGGSVREVLALMEQKLDITIG